MKKHELFHTEPDDAAKETLLRATFHRHATSTVDIDQGWEKIAPQVRTARQQTSSLQTAPRFLLNPFRQPQGEKPFLRRWHMIAASVVLLLVLLGTGIVGGPLSSWLGGNQIAYAQVNQSQQAYGITITLVEAYASKAGTFLVVKARENGQGPAHDVYVTLLYATLRYQQEYIPTIHRKPGESDRTSTCQTFRAPAVHPAADVHTISLTWYVAKLALSKTDTIKSQNKVYHLVIANPQGDWIFHFTIPFHQDDSKPGQALRC